MADDKTVNYVEERPFPLLIDAIAVQNCFIMPEQLARPIPSRQSTKSLAPVHIASSKLRKSLPQVAAPPGKSSMATCRAGSRRNGPAAARSPTFREISGRLCGRRHRVGRVAKRGGLVRASASRSRAAAENSSDIVIAPSNRRATSGGCGSTVFTRRSMTFVYAARCWSPVNQEDYMRTIMGDDRSAWRVCRSASTPVAQHMASRSICRSRRRPRDGQQNDPGSRLP